MGLKHIILPGLVSCTIALSGAGCRTQNTPYPHTLQSTLPNLSTTAHLKPSSLQLPSGVWLAGNYSSKWYEDRDAITQAVNQSLQLGVNAIYPVIQDKQTFYYRSQVIKSQFGQSFIFAFRLDPLAETIAVAKKHNLRVFPSFESGLTVPLHQEHSGKKTFFGKLISQRWNWLSVGRDGEILNYCKYDICFGFLNILNPYVTHLLVQLTEEVLTNYAVDGVIFDDHFSLPAEQLGCEPTVQYDPQQRAQFARWLEATSKSTADHTEACIEYSNILRTRAIVDFFAKIHAIAQKHGKHIIISPAGTPGWSKRNWLQDWRTMAKEGVVDGVIMQAYRRSADAFRNMLHSAELDFLFEPSSKVGFGVVIMLGLKSRHTDYTGQLIANQTSLAINAGVTPSYYYHEMIDIPVDGGSKSSRVASIKSIQHQLIKHFSVTTAAAP